MFLFQQVQETSYIKGRKELQSFIILHTIKEDGKWKIKKIFHNALFYTPYPGGWQHLADTPEPPGPPTFARYPSGKIFPYHYKNHVTGK